MSNDAKKIKKSELVSEIQEFTPIDYFRAIKNQLGIRIKAVEIEYIENLQEKKVVPEFVINAIVSYILMVKKQTTINKKYLITIAEDWAKNGIVTPEKAIDHLFDLKNPKNKSIYKRKYQTKKSKRIEKLPEHVINPPKEQPLSPERETELNQKLAEYFKKQSEEEEKLYR